MIKYLAFAFCIAAVSADVLQEFYQSNNLFTSDVYREISKTVEGNFVVSPFSAKTILSLAQLGAKGLTAQELSTRLYLPKEETRTRFLFKNLIPRLTSNEESYTLKTLNKIYINKKISVRQNFNKTANDVFYSSVESLDFSRQDIAVKIINDWVYQQTKGTIQDLINSVDDNTKLILINAIYFHAFWKTPFFKEFTKKGDFFKTSKTKAQVLMMYEAITFYRYYENNDLDAKFLEMPFEHEQATITFVLPNKIEGLTRLENEIEKVLQPQNLTLELVDLAIPKFKIETRTDFRSILRNLGVKKAFLPGEADFSGISQQELLIDDVHQKTFIDVNEQGVEAAAATYIRLVDYIGVETPAKRFYADHPFIYFIKVRELVLFVGRVTLPRY